MNSLKNRKVRKTSKYRINDQKVISEFSRKDIEDSYKIKSVDGTEAYYSNRYGWTLRKVTE